ncbi:MAG: O-antigen ligase family protein [Gemmatimonadaceae bacterium]|nr:O-antigen ligase family protein [Gemmatimonadaceae bacterium]
MSGRLRGWLWAALAALTILNANSIAVLAGAPERLFNPILLAVALAVLAPHVARLRWLSRAPMPALLVFAVAFLLAGAFSAAGSVQVPLDRALFKIPLYGASLLLVLAAFGAAADATARGEEDRLLRAVFWPCVLASLSGVAFIAVPAVGNFLELQPGERLHGVFGNFNELGGQAGYALVVGLVLTMRTKQPFWVVLGTLAGIVGVVSSFSKAAMLGFLPLFALTVYAATGARFAIRPMLALAFGSVLVAGGTYLLAGRLLDGGLGIELSTDQRLRLTALMDIISSGALDESATTGRTAVWAVGLENWAQAPVFGLGLSAFDRVTGIDMEIHNTALRVLGEGGLVAFLPFLVMVVALVLRIARERRPEVHVLGVGFLLVQLPAILSTGGILLARNHNVLAGLVLGLLVASRDAGAAGPSAPDDAPAGATPVPAGA